MNLDFGNGKAGAFETKTLHALALDSREAHITTSEERLRDGKHTVTIRPTTGLCVTV